TSAINCSRDKEARSSSMCGSWWRGAVLDARRTPVRVIEDSMTKVDLVCIDVDGTLLETDGTIADEVWDALGALRERGVRLAICSGRPAFGVTLEYARRLDP